MTPYVFAYSSLCADHVADAILNDTEAVTTWVRPFPHAAVVLSNLALSDLSAVLHKRLGETWFLLSPIPPGQADGWLPMNVWSFVNHRPDAPQPTLPTPAPSAAPGILQAVAESLEPRVSKPS